MTLTSHVIDVWFATHGNGDRYSIINGSFVDNALLIWLNFKELQRQDRLVDDQESGYQLNDPTLIAEFAKAYEYAQARYDYAVKHNGGFDDPNFDSK